MMHHVFLELGLTSIGAEAWDVNTRSVRILQRLGMREIGRGESGTFLGTPTFYRKFDVTRDVWLG